MLVHVLSFLLDVADRVRLQLTCKAILRVVHGEWTSLLKFHQVMQWTDGISPEEMAINFLGYFLPTVDMIFKIHLEEKISFEEFADRSTYYRNDDSAVIETGGYDLVMYTSGILELHYTAGLDAPALQYPYPSATSLLKKVANMIFDLLGVHIAVKLSDITVYNVHCRTEGPNFRQKNLLVGKEIREKIKTVSFSQNGILIRANQYLARDEVAKILRISGPPPLFVFPRCFPCAYCMEIKSSSYMIGSYCKLCLYSMQYCVRCNQTSNGLPQLNEPFFMDCMPCAVYQKGPYTEEHQKNRRVFKARNRRFLGAVDRAYKGRRKRKRSQQ